MSRQCECGLCVRHRRIRRIADSVDVPAIRLLVLELEGLLANAEADLEYKTVNLDGTWPSAPEQLAGSLAKALEWRDKQRMRGTE